MPGQGLLQNLVGKLLNYKAFDKNMFDFLLIRAQHQECFEIDYELKLRDTLNKMIGYQNIQKQYVMLNDYCQERHRQSSQMSLLIVPEISVNSLDSTRQQFPPFLDFLQTVVSVLGLKDSLWVVQEYESTFQELQSRKDDKLYSPSLKGTVLLNDKKTGQFYFTIMQTLVLLAFNSRTSLHLSQLQQVYEKHPSWKQEVLESVESLTQSKSDILVQEGQEIRTNPEYAAGEEREHFLHQSMRVGNVRQYKSSEKKVFSEVFVKNMIESKIVKSLKHNKEANIL